MGNEQNNGYSCSKVSAIEPCALKNTLVEPEKKLRYNERLEFIEKGKKSQDPLVIRAALRLERNNKAVERAKLCADVYSADDEKKSPVPEKGRPEGWFPLNDKDLEKLGLSNSDLVNEETGLKAAVYKSNFEQMPPEYVVVFAGTDFTSLKDWGTNIGQGAGLETEQYNEAMRIAGKVMANTGGAENVEFAGHSLGGGLASAAAMVTGSKATTINSSGLNPKTAERLNIDEEVQAHRSQNIDAFYSGSDPLSNVQDSLSIPSAAGNRHEVTVAPENSHTWLGLIVPTLLGSLLDPLLGIGIGLYKLANMALDGHSSTTMVSNIEHEKSQDLNTIILSTNDSVLA
jgi:type VI secretion system secreted protein VgrG